MILIDFGMGCLENPVSHLNGINLERRKEIFEICAHKKLLWVLTIKTICNYPGILPQRPQGTKMMKLSISSIFDEQHIETNKKIRKPIHCLIRIYLYFVPLCLGG